MKNSPGFWLIMTILGTLLPGIFTLMFSVEQLGTNGGFSFYNLLMLSPAFYHQAFASYVSTQLLMDILLVTVMFFVWMYPEGKRLKMQHLWIYPVLTYGLAFSIAAPLFMYQRAKKMSTQASYPPGYNNWSQL